MAPDPGQAREKFVRISELGFSHVAFANGAVANHEKHDVRALHAACDKHGLGLLLEADSTSIYPYDFCSRTAPFASSTGRREERRLLALLALRAQPLSRARSQSS